jgi:hypothetical protein
MQVALGKTVFQSLKGAIRCQQRGVALVAAVDDLEQQVGGVG